MVQDDSLWDNTDTQPRRSKDKFDVVLTSLNPDRRLQVMDALLKNDLTTDLTPQEAVRMVFQLPSYPLRCASLTDAAAMQLILEVAGGEAKIRESRYCG